MKRINKTLKVYMMIFLLSSYSIYAISQGANQANTILLSSPLDKEKLSNILPIFNWISSEINSTSQIGDGSPQTVSTKITIVNIGANQQKEIAMSSNEPHYSTSVTNSFFSYNSQLPVLEKGHKYAWHIEQFTNGILTGQSDIWEFEIPKEQNNLYIDITKNTTSATCNQGCLYLLYTESVSPGIAKFEIKSKDQLILSNDIQVLEGENYLKIDLKNYNLILHHVYTLEFTGINKKTYVINFKYEEND